MKVMRKNLISAAMFSIFLGFFSLFPSCVSKPAQNKIIIKYICQNPVVAGVAYDQTGSMRWSGTPSLTKEDLKPLIELLSICGGTLGVTFVRADSSKPVERFKSSEPPPLPSEPTQDKDEEDYEFADRLDEYYQQINERDRAIEQKKTELQPEIENYLKEIAPLLAQEPKGETDFWTAINRLDVYLAEGDTTWHTKPHRFLIIVSDSEDTIGRTKNAFKSDAVILWVNANAPDRNLKDFPYKRFESFKAAIAEILALEGVKENGK